VEPLLAKEKFFSQELKKTQKIKMVKSWWLKIIKNIINAGDYKWMR
jgi:hypothetical protein